MTCLNCRRLREEVEELNEKVIRLQDAMIPASIVSDLTRRFGLTTQQAKLVAALVEHGFRKKSQLMDALYSDADDEPDIKILGVFKCKANKKLRPHGLEIETVWGQGYKISDEHRAEIKDRCAAPVNPKRFGGDAG